MDFIDAIVTGNRKKVFELLSAGVDVTLCDDADNITPLHHAVSAGSIEIIFLLLEYGADPHKRYLETGQTVFELACSLNRWQVISLIANWNLNSNVVH